MELKNFLSRWSAESRVFLSRCISRERSEDTLQRLLEKVNRVPLHEDFHFRVTNGQRAEVKRACTAREYLCFPRPLRHQEFVCLLSVSPQQIQISLHKFHRIYRLSIFHYLKIEIRSFHAIVFCRFIQQTDRLTCCNSISF